MTRVLLSLLLLALGALAATAEDVAVCTYAELGSITTNSNRTVCAKESGVEMAELDGAPSDAQMDAVCASDACVSLINAILALDPDDCTLPTNENLQLMSEFVDPVVAYCSEQGVSFLSTNSSTDSSGDVDVGDDDSASASAAGSGSVGSAGSNGAASTSATRAVFALAAAAASALAVLL